MNRLKESAQDKLRNTCLGILCALLLIEPCLAQTQGAHRFEIVIYGGTSSAVIAAVEARHCGKTVAIVCPEKHLGGLSAGGLGWTDTGNKAVIGGLARSEFYHRIWQHYQVEDNWKWQTQTEYGNRGQGTPAIDGNQKTMWIFEPHAAEQAFEDLIAEFEIPVYRDHWLDRSQGGVTKAGKRIVGIRTTNGKRFEGKMFLDATYEGDLMAAAGVSYHVGREANSVYNETWNGVQVGVLHHKHWFSSKISAYRTPGDPASGILPRISQTPPGIKGDGDHRIQAYCYRMCLTDVKENQIPFKKPASYDASQYEILQRVLESEWMEVFEKFDPIPNRKTDTNNHGPFSTDNIGMNYEYPEASYERRREILEEHQDYQQGLMYYLANDPRVPKKIQRSFAKWGLSKDEFKDNEGWPHQIYVREARRMIGQYVMTEHDCLGTRGTPKPVGMGSYTLDSHNVQRYVTPEGFVQNEGDIGVKVPQPYQVSYDSLVPKSEECENLLVPVCVSSSHIAFGSIRMEPVFMILGHSAAAAASLAIDMNLPIQEVPYDRLAAQLRDEGQILDLGQSNALLTQNIQGIVQDDAAAQLEGKWTTSTSSNPYVALGYRHDGNTNKGESKATFLLRLEDPGRYEVRLAFPAYKNRATNTPVEIESAEGIARVKVNQSTTKELVDGQWFSLGTYTFEKQAKIVISNQDTDGYVIIDAVQLLKQP